MLPRVCCAEGERVTASAHPYSDEQSPHVLRQHLHPCQALKQAAQSAYVDAATPPPVQQTRAHHHFRAAQMTAASLAQARTQSAGVRLPCHTARATSPACRRPPSGAGGGSALARRSPAPAAHAPPRQRASLSSARVRSGRLAHRASPPRPPARRAHAARRRHWHTAAPVRRPAAAARAASARRRAARSDEGVRALTPPASSGARPWCPRGSRS